ncbi:hypothetical protein [Streptomyces indicus]|uniref:hypothetical protein n=1 Tax=Streptomyces indicus TaxID=417292 RepID=UPI002481E6DF|nr:hypothetical protein [Streptomyces indicus]
MLLLIPLVVVAGSDAFRAALDFTTGVLCLVALTCSIAWGLVASDRLFLSPKQRLLAQGVHRATAIAALGFLLLHGTVKLVLDHVSALGALVPFGLGVTGTDGLIGFGALAGLLMIVAGVTGALRSSFASPARIAGRWRALHMLAYPAWCSALVHGLYAGRAPSTWVVVLYCLCLAGVAGALALRAAPLPVKRKVAARVLALLNRQPAPDRGEPVETPRREGPLPGMSGVPGAGGLSAAGGLSGAGGLPGLGALGQAAEPAASRPQLPSQTGGSRPSYAEETRRYETEPRLYGEETRLYEEATRSYEERPRAGDGMAAAYRAVSSAPGARPLPLQEEEHSGRWPSPSPPPPGEAARPVVMPAASPASSSPASSSYDTGPVPVYDTGSVPTVGGTGSVPTVGDTGSVPTVAPGPVPTADPAAAPPSVPDRSSEVPFYVTSDPYDTGSTPTYGSGPIAPYDTGQTPPAPLYEAPTEPIAAPLASPIASPVAGPLASPLGNPVAGPLGYPVPAPGPAPAPGPGPSPFEAPAAGEPWSAPGAPSTGGRR